MKGPRRRPDALSVPADRIFGVPVEPAHDPELLRNTLVLARHAAIVVALIVVAVIPEAVPRRELLAGTLLLVVLPYDLVVGTMARRHGQMPRISCIVDPLLPVTFAFAVPELWVIALLAGTGVQGLVAVEFGLTGAVVGAALSLAGFAVVALTRHPESAAIGLAGLAVFAGLVSVAAGALFDALRSSEARYAEILANANDMIYTHELAPPFRFLSVNDAALRMIGYDRQQLAGVGVADVVAPSSRERAMEAVRRKLEGTSDTTTYEVDLVRHNGTLLPVEVSSRLVRRRGVAVAVQGIARDISGRRRIQEEQAALDRGGKEFIAFAAH